MYNIRILYDKSKERRRHSFYAFIVVFIVIAYLNNQGTFTSLFLKKLSFQIKIVQLEFKDKEYKADYAKI